MTNGNALAWADRILVLMPGNWSFDSELALLGADSGNVSAATAVPRPSPRPATTSDRNSPEWTPPRTDPGTPRVTGPSSPATAGQNRTGEQPNRRTPSC